MGDAPFCEGVERRLARLKEQRARCAAVQSKPLRRLSTLSYAASRGCPPLQSFFRGGAS